MAADFWFCQQIVLDSFSLDSFKIQEENRNETAPPGGSFDLESHWKCNDVVDLTPILAILKIFKRI